MPSNDHSFAQADRPNQSFPRVSIKEILTEIEQAFRQDADELQKLLTNDNSIKEKISATLFEFLADSSPQNQKNSKALHNVLEILVGRKPAKLILDALKSDSVIWLKMIRPALHQEAFQFIQELRIKYGYRFQVLYTRT